MKNTTNIVMELASAAVKDAEKIINNFVKKNKMNKERANKILNRFLKDTRPIRKQLSKIAKENVSGKVKKVREILRLFDKSLLFLEKELRKIK